MTGDLLSALCLVAVIEGLLLFAAPGAWRRAAEQMLALPEARLRVVGGLVMAMGLLALLGVRGAT